MSESQPQFAEDPHAAVSRYMKAAALALKKLSQNAKDESVRLNAATEVLKHGRTMERLKAGDGPAPRAGQRLSNAELARRIMLALSRGDPAFQAAILADREARIRGP